MERSADFLAETAAIVRAVVSPQSPDFKQRYFEALDTFMALNASSSELLLGRYRWLLSQPHAARDKLLFMAAEEACGAAILRHFMQWADGKLLQDLALHAKDEERHAQMLSRAAQNFVPNGRRYKSLAVDPSNELIGAKWEDFPKCLWNIHINEIAAFSTYYAMKMLIDDLDSVPTDRLAHTLQSLMKDELNHIRYTAEYLEAWVNSQVLDWSELIEGIAGYDRIIAEEIERMDRSLSVPGGYPFDERLVITSEKLDHLPRDLT